MNRIAFRLVPAAGLLVAAYAWVAPLVSGQASLVEPADPRLVVELLTKLAS